MPRPIDLDELKAYVVELEEQANRGIRTERINKTLFEIANALISEASLHDLYRSIHRILGNLMDMTNFYIAIYYPEKNAIKFEYQVDEKEIPVVRWFHNVHDTESLTLGVIRMKKPMMLREEEMKKLEKEGRLLGHCAKIWLGVPLKIQDDVIGVMAVQSYTNADQFDESDVEVLSFVSDQIALSIDKKRAQELLKETQEKLIQSEKLAAIGTLAAGIAHDFNNVLFVITGNAEVGLEDIPEWNPVHANLRDIRSAGLRGAGIVKQLLNFSRVTPQELKPIDAVAVIKDALTFLRSTIPSTIEFRQHLPDKDITILADPIQINRVLMNICTNASQEMEEQGGVLEIKVETEKTIEGIVDRLFELPAGDYLIISVTDTGQGIAPEIVGRIFDPYFSTKDVGKGSGMGLTVVQGIVKNHNGAIAVDSPPGAGATFTLRFPMVSQRPAVAVEAATEVLRGDETILFVDDEKPIATMAGKMLAKLGYSVETAIRPIDALERFQSRPDYFDLVITDMTMPGMTGVTLSEKIRAIRSDIPVIICTGHSSQIDEERAVALGIDGYVMKPIEMKSIARTIRKALGVPEKA